MVEFGKGLLRAISVLTLVTIGAATCSAGAPTDAGEIVRPAHFATDVADVHGYYLEFRARQDAEFGHAYMVLGTVDAGGSAHRAGTFGFGTATGAPSGMASLFGAPGQIGYTRADLIQQPAVQFRVGIKGATYHRIVRSVARMRTSWTSYELLTLNCNTFAGEIARMAGLKTPDNESLMPIDYVSALKTLNHHDD